MNRRGFLSKLIAGAAGAAVAPHLPVPVPAPVVIPYRELVGRVTFSGPELARARTVDACLRDIYAPHIAKMVNEPSPFFDTLLNERGGDDA